MSRAGRRGFATIWRGIVTDAVPRADAIFNLSRTALAVVALTTDPDSLLAATEDRLHQGYRAPAMPETAAARARPVARASGSAWT